jgi:hypothetical protein
MKRAKRGSSFSPTFAALQRKLGSGFTVGDLISRYLPIRELRIVAFVRKGRIAEYCERKHSGFWTLHYNHKHIKHIFNSFAYLKCLELTDNELTEIPDAIGQCVLLDTLNMCSNRIANIPDAIGNCTKLQMIFFHCNVIEAVPETIGNLRKLRELHLDRNCIKSIPSTIGNCTKLRVLDLDQNKLESIPQTLINCAKLSVLWVRYNAVVVQIPLFTHNVSVYKSIN